MARSTYSGSRCASPAPATTEAPSSAARHTGRSVPTDTTGQRGVPAQYGGRHHMGSHGPAALSETIPEKPWGLNAASKGYGSRHHYGAEIRAQVQADAQVEAQAQAANLSPDAVADQVVAGMFGGMASGGVDQSEEELLAEAEALLEEVELEG